MAFLRLLISDTLVGFMGYLSIKLKGDLCFLNEVLYHYFSSTYEQNLRQ